MKGWFFFIIPAAPDRVRGRRWNPGKTRDEIEGCIIMAS
jgi:hypothetical protein